MILKGYLLALPLFIIFCQVRFLDYTQSINQSVCESPGHRVAHVIVSECKLCYIIYVVVQRAKRKTAVAILVPQFAYFNFHMNFSCKLSVYIYICFLCMKIENLFYSILLPRKLTIVISYKNSRIIPNRHDKY